MHVHNMCLSHIIHYRHVSTAVEICWLCTTCDKHSLHMCNCWSY